MNAVFAFAGGLVIGAGLVAGLWIHDIEKAWLPTEEDALLAWEIATDADSKNREGASKRAMIWWHAWRAALGCREEVDHGRTRQAGA